MQSYDTHWNCMEKKDMEEKSNGAAKNGAALSSNGEAMHRIAMAEHDSAQPRRG